MKTGVLKSLRTLVIGGARDLSDRALFHKVSLVAVLAWVGLGADGLSSSCYGPEEAFKALGAHPSLSIIVALMSVITIVLICASYRQIIALFPSGGGGYLVASKLLSPTAGVISGCALLVDYVLTITISIASGADALFSLVGPEWQAWKLAFSCAGVLLLTIVNLRGVRESVMLWTPVFFLFVATHAAAILIGAFSHGSELHAVGANVVRDTVGASRELGLLGLGALLLRAYSMGAGTFTGIEAVSNGLPILREPKVQTGKRTMNYMGASLAITVFGLMTCYLLYRVQPVEGKTLNAVMFEAMTQHWPAALGKSFVAVSMISAAALLIIAAQAGFLDGPRVAANMALDRWFPARFATLSDRFVTQNGILLMGSTALLAMLATRGSVNLLVVLYSINVFVTFSLSQFGMARHWWKVRATETQWFRKLAINGVGFAATAFILISLCAVKFWEGGWVTVAVTSALVVAAFLIKRHYLQARGALGRLDEVVAQLEREQASKGTMLRRGNRTAIVLVNGFNGLGVHTFLGIPRLFPDAFGKFVFVQVGAVDAGTFKGAEELENLKAETAANVERYAAIARKYGFEARGISEVSNDVLGTLEDTCQRLVEAEPTAVTFGGQLAFSRETIWTRWLHNYAVFALQRTFCRRGHPFVIVPARV